MTRVSEAPSRSAPLVGSALLVFLVDVGLGHAAAMQALVRWGCARFLAEAEYRHFPGIVSEGSAA